MSKYANRRDHTQATCQRRFEQRGCEVLDLSRVGKGCGDLLVLHRDRIHLCEVKNLKTGYGRRGLNENQRKFARRWPMDTVTDEDSVDALVDRWEGK